jgi:dipeptidyl aminopeptidase/acylaminoacyl peptidase
LGVIRHRSHLRVDDGGRDLASGAVGTGNGGGVTALMPSSGMLPPITILTAGAQGRTPWWSPDGAFVTFESNRPFAESLSYRIFVQRRDTIGSEDATPVTPFAMSAQHAKWAPGGQRLVFAAGFRVTTRGGIAIAERARPSYRDGVQRNRPGSHARASSARCWKWTIRCSLRVRKWPP